MKYSLVWVKVIICSLLGLKLELQRAQIEQKYIFAYEESISQPVKSDDQMEDLSEIINQVIEVSNRQIENSRSQTEEAITVMSGCFTSLVDRLNELPKVINRQVEQVANGEIVALNVDEILTSIKLNYTTAEEFSLHHGVDVESQGQHEIELF